MLDEGAAALLAGNANLAGQPLPLEAALARTHPDDRSWVFERIRRVRQTGGSISAEFRILTEMNDVRWVLNRGALAPDETGAMQGRGAYIDTTDAHRDAFISAASLNQETVSTLDVAADHCIAAHAALGRGGHFDLHRISEMLLFGIGRALARRG
ncbi:PAS domain-containing protein [Methylobacterium sp. J-088]|uniref:PAS domain-containing protein n=1 Tax=unclassified Methylobacterium TaxID=2615210 RepID=UPI001FB9D6BB|nr:PAS domain-containing protein [Methylobacterium sp. J-088]MCJ2062929.1 PAS domain-containing protein [Methylobacterium sp. J-088]